MNSSSRTLAKTLITGSASREFIEYVGRRLQPLELPKSSSAWLAPARTLRTDVVNLLLRGRPDGLLEQPPQVRKLGVIETGAGYHIRKLTYEGYPGMWVAAVMNSDRLPTTAQLRVWQRRAAAKIDDYTAGSSAMAFAQEASGLGLIFQLEIDFVEVDTGSRARSKTTIRVQHDPLGTHNLESGFDSLDYGIN